MNVKFKSMTKYYIFQYYKLFPLKWLLRLKKRFYTFLVFLSSTLEIHYLLCPQLKILSYHIFKHYTGENVVYDIE